MNNAELTEVVNDMRDRMSELESAIKAHVAVCAELRKQDVGRESRLRNLEKRFWIATGIVAALQAVGIAGIYKLVIG